MTLAPDLLTALGMTALSAWSLAWVMWLLGRQHWRRGLAQALLSLIFFGAAYFFFGLESRIRSSWMQGASLLSISVGVGMFTLALQRFRQSSNPRRDVMTLVLPSAATVLLAAVFLPDEIHYLNRLHAVVTIAQMGYMFSILQRMRSSTPGKGWMLITTAMAVQTASLLPFLFMPSEAATMSVQDSTLAQQIGRWVACMVMFLNMVVTSMGFLLMQRDRQMAVDQDKASLDNLTQLPLRGRLIKQLQKAIAQSHQQSSPLSVLVIDIDHFKRFNDNYGHLAGDRVIQLVAQTLQAHLRKGDMAARYGGEEFVLLLPETDAPIALAIAQRLCDSIRSLPLLLPSGATLHITISVGVHTASASAVAHTWEAWIAAADAAMYQAKQSGRDRVLASTVTALPVAA